MSADLKAIDRQLPVPSFLSVFDNQYLTGIVKKVIQTTCDDQIIQA